MRVKPNIDKQQLYTIGDRIRAIRAAQTPKLNQEDLAEALGVARETVGQWERGETPPSLSYLLKICDLYHVDLDYITGRLDCQTHDLQYVHDLTGLSEDAIKKLIQFKYNNKGHARADIVSILIEQFNAEYMIDLIGQRISASPNVTPKDLKDMTPNQLSAYAASTTLTVNLDGSTFLVNKNNFIDSQISTAIVRDLPEIVSAYNQQHDQTPAARAADYAKFQSDLTRRLTEEYHAGRIDADDLTPQLRAAIDDYLRS